MRNNTPKRTSITPAIRKEIIKIIDERIAEVHVTKEDFSELKGIVRELAVAQKELTEAQKRTEVKVEELAEAQKRTEVKIEELITAQKHTDERMEFGFKKLDDRISALGGRWGYMAEETFRNTIEELLKTTGYTVSKGMYGDREVDIIIKNGDHILLEITSSMKRSDIEKYIASADDYEMKNKISPRIMIATIYISPKLFRDISEAPRKLEIFSIDGE